MAAGDAEKIRRAAEAAARQKLTELHRAIVGAFREGQRRFVRSMTTERLSGAGPSSLGVRTGQLRRSLGAVVIPTERAVQLTGFIGGGVPYARIHETGGTIRPKKSKYLTIPLGAAKTAAGVLRAGARAWPTPLKFLKIRGKKFLVEAMDVQRPAKFQGWGGAFTPAKTVRQVLRSKKARTIRTGTFTNTPGGRFELLKRSRIKPVFLLVESVTLPARMGFRRTFEREAEKTLAEVRTATVRIMGSK